MENKQKRFYKVGEEVWLFNEKEKATVQSINKDKVEVTLEMANGESKTVNLWDIDKLKYKAAEVNMALTSLRYTYFSPIQNGIVPTKSIENAGRDCYARLEPKTINGKEVFEMFLPQLKLSKIPLGFASYLNQDDVLSLKHERSSVGSTGLINVSGLIDSTYQGEVILQVVPLVCDIIITSEIEEKYYDEKSNVFFVPYGKAITQAVTFKLSQAEDVVVPYEELLSKPSNRGTAGWGSSGK